MGLLRKRGEKSFVILCSGGHLPPPPPLATPLHHWQYNDCIPSRMPLRGWSLAQVDVSMSHSPFYENYTGCQSDAVSSLRSPHWCSRHWTAWHLHTWSTIATWSAMTLATTFSCLLHVCGTKDKARVYIQTLRATKHPCTFLNLYMFIVAFQNEWIYFDESVNIFIGKWKCLTFLTGT